MSCGSKKQHEIQLFNELTFQIYKGEAITDVNYNSKTQYFKYFNNQTIQIPLFKYIKHNDYEIFIGIPYNTSIENMLKNQLEKQDCTMTNFRIDSLAYYKKYVRDNFYITEYATKSPSKSLIYIATISKLANLSDSLFNELELVKRINIKK